jgi:signal transduction histidine kinase
VLEETKNTLRERIEETQATFRADHLPHINASRFQFAQLFQNLLSNSLKFTKPGRLPVITIRANEVKGSSLPFETADKRKNYVQLTISDNGIGFDQQYAKRIFELFQRLHREEEYPGTGIGLAICKKIVENHQGFITATGAEEEGATFEIYLPI